METVTKEQIKCIKTMQGKLGDVLAKTVVSGCTLGRTERVSELHKHEAAKVIAELKRLDPEEVRAEKMRRKLIALAYQRAGLPVRANTAQKAAVIDWLDEWCRKYGHGHKGLNSYTYKELPMLVSQFEKVMDSLVVKL